MRSSPRSEGEEQEWFATESIRPVVGSATKIVANWATMGGGVRPGGGDVSYSHIPRWKVEVGRRS